MGRAAGVGLVLLGLVACSPDKPCVGDQCLDVSGDYLVTVTPDVHCERWAVKVLPVLSFHIDQSGSALLMHFQPSVESPNHVLSGTIDGANVVALNEQPSQVLPPLPYAGISGAFTPTASPSGLFFLGTLTLTSPGGNFDGGPDAQCAGAFTVQAQRQPGPSVLAGDGGLELDGGALLPDGGASPFAAPADGGA